MTSRFVRAFVRLARSVGRTAAVAAVALAAGAAPLAAQSTGKIEGRVRDQAGAPIANAQVQVVGTAFNATTNPQGYYFLNNVTAGTVALQANFIGFKGTRVEGVRVLAGQTLTQDFALERSVVELEAVNVQVATVPLVPRDEVSTKQRVDGDYVDKLPVDRVNQVLALQPGVVASDNGDTLSIRGGRPDEAATYIDGVPVQRGQRLLRLQGVGANVSTADPSQSVSTVGVEEASVTTGASSAEYGNAQSGIINLATRTGSSTGYNGTIGFETDEVFGKLTSLGRNRVQLSFGGPARILPNLTFFVGGDLEGQKSIEAPLNAEQAPFFVIPTDDQGRFVTDTNLTAPDGSVVPVYAFAVSRGTCDRFAGSANAQIANNYGQECNGIRTPGTNGSSYRVQGKLNYTYGSGSRIAFTTLMNQAQNRLAVNNITGGVNDIFAPELQFGARNWSKYYILNWTQNLSKSAERAFALDASVSYQLDRYQRAPFNSAPGEGTLGFYVKPYDFRFGFNDLDLSEELIRNIRTNTGKRTLVDPTLYGSDEFTAKTVDLRNPYGVVDEYLTNGFPAGRFQLYRENRWIGKGKVDWQADRYNRIQFGGEFTRYFNANYSYVTTSQAFNDAYIERPIRWNAFVEDRLDLGDVVLQLGARYDRYDTRASRPFYVCTEAQATGGQCEPGVAVGDTAQAFRISTNPQADPSNIDAIFRRDEAHGYLSPHVQVSFPVTDKTNFRLSYAHQVQAPDFAILFAGLNTDLSYTNSNQLWGSDVDFGKSVTYEFGIRHAFSDDMVLDFSAYNRDNLANATARKELRFDPLRGTMGGINVLQNADFGNTRGVDVRLDRRIGQFFNGTLAYSYTQAQSTGSDPFEYINTAGRNISALSATGFLAPPQAIAPVALSRPHSLTAAASLALPANWKEGSALGAVLGNFAVFSTLRVQSGTAYTLCAEEGNFDTRTGVQCEGAPRAGINTQRLPSFKSLDMRFTKGFGLGGTNVTAYLDARNILNFKNLVDVFVNTGDVVSQQDIEITQTNYRASIAQLGTPSGAYDAETETLDLTFGGTGPQTQSCVGFATDEDPTSASIANCVYLIRAEQRFGNGDGLYTADEQNAAATAFYNINDGPQDFYGTGRRMRVGFELNF